MMSIFCEAPIKSLSLTAYRSPTLLPILVTFAQIFVLIIVFSGCTDNSQIEVLIGDDIFRIPVSRLSEASRNPKAKNGFDPYGPVVALTWSAREMKAHVPGFIERTDEVTYSFNVLIYANNQGNLEARLDSYLSRGQFSNGTYQYDKALDAYRINQNIERSRWDFLSVAPNSKRVPPRSIDEFWLAECRQPVLRNLLICTSETKYRNHYVEFHFVGKNLRLRSQLVKFVTQQLDSFLLDTT